HLAQKKPRVSGAECFGGTSNVRTAYAVRSTDGRLARPLRPRRDGDHKNALLRRSWRRHGWHRGRQFPKLDSLLSEPREPQARQKHPALRAAGCIGGVINHLNDLAALLCAASSSSRLASCLSSQSRASAAPLRQVGCCPLSRGNGALRSIVAIDRNNRR